MARVIRSERAQEDLEGILDYLDGQSDQAANRFALKLDAACDLHAKHPQAGASSASQIPRTQPYGQSVACTRTDRRKLA